MSHKQNPPRQDRRSIGRAVVRKHEAPSVGSETAAPGFFNPDMARGKRQRAALEAAMYSARNK
ncbi:hypothetical protein ABIE85_007108 [Bradyrhizobium diazoefficiens]|jgi:hypothetical protein|uniref:Uncharacterized protein n=1 Tax=Bradyrhizobium diazoefficiens TaxID=1355477 RepID=A0A810B3W1_9BRAD|nr:hypothetical protein [Bradyrhizobium diazoefficiens]MBP1060182.1 hypothetical protein [Bradyrhizobium japonicum]AWO88236.1 hypothetical protein DI395_06460 [Bradyrhizobium diazoefficiens]WLA57463.1 hypothetical protein QIH81_01570 [Bradyrhizobium diazoefficiens]BCA00294.1 hypothetical protein H12S4_11980 [Bradyrhizobium diazoefficiens]BCA17978.1 hypothetical protein BDHH15_11930 [Bradyrhizobium diazoefficiens]